MEERKSTISPSSQASLSPPPQSYPISDNENQIIFIHSIEKGQSESPYTNKSTYVIQFPKDQVYRVPSPENARIAEFHRNTPKDNTKRINCKYFGVVLVAIVVIIAGVIGGLFAFLNMQKDPRFSIKSFLLSGTNRTKYEISLQVDNPNTNAGILYKEGGVASLSLRQQGIASGIYPSFYQGHGGSKVFDITLKGSKTGLLNKEVDGKSMKTDKTKVHVALSLSILVPAQYKMGGLHSGTIKYNVTCRLTVDTLAKGTRLLSQQCQTKRLQQQGR